MGLQHLAMLTYAGKTESESNAGIKLRSEPPPSIYYVSRPTMVRTESVVTRMLCVDCGLCERKGQMSSQGYLVQEGWLSTSCN